MILDSNGLENPSDSGKSKLVNIFFKDVVLKTSDYQLYIINRLNAIDLENLKNIRGKLLIIHNLKEATTDKQVRDILRQDIENVFDSA